MTRRRKKTNPITLLLEFLLLVVIVVIVFNWGSLLKIIKTQLNLNYFDIELVSTIEYTEQESKANSSIFVENDRLIVCESNRLMVYDEDGNGVLSSELNAESTLVRGYEEKVLITETTRGEMYIIDFDGNVYAKINDQGRIKDVFYHKDKLVVALLDDNKTIKVYDRDFNILNEIKIPGGDISSIKISYDNDLIVVSSITMVNNVITSNVYQYDSFGRLLGITNVKDSIVLQFEINEDSIHLVTLDSIITLNREGKELSKSHINGIVSKLSLNDNIYLNVIENRDVIINEDIDSMLQSISYEGELLDSTSIEKELKKIVVNKNYVATLTMDNINIYNKNLELIISKEVTDDVKDLFWINNYTLASVENSVIKIFKVE